MCLNRRYFPPSQNPIKAIFLQTQQPALHLLPLEFKTYRITVMQKAKVKQSIRHLWSKNEVRLLKKLYPDGRAREIAKRTGRPLTAIKQKAYSMGITINEKWKWSAEEIKLLKKLYPNESIRNIAEKLGRSKQAVMHKAHDEGLGLKKKKYPHWSTQEINMLKRMYPDNSSQVIANKLGRTSLAVISKASQLFSHL